MKPKQSGAGFTLIRTLLRRNLVNVHGFTLIELLITVIIIAVLVVIGITVFSGTQQKARDARRRSDVISISKALEVNKQVSSYTTIQSSFFSRNIIPQDSYTTGATPPKYCILSRVSGTISQPTVWADTLNCPTAAESSGTTVDPIPSTGGVPSGTYGVFLVCSLLEGGSTPPNIYCSSSLQ